MTSIQTILYPTDFSDQSDSAFRFACSLAEHYDARLVVLHVEPPPVSAGWPRAGHTNEHLEHKLRRYKELAPTLSVDYRLEEGFASDEILRIAQQTKADLIVMGTHGRTGVGRLLMGIVGEQVVRKSPCPVLTVKAPLATNKTGSHAHANDAPDRSRRAMTCESAPWDGR
jgi:universal stress protein A